MNFRHIILGFISAWGFVTGHGQEVIHSGPEGSYRMLPSYSEVIQTLHFPTELRSKWRVKDRDGWIAIKCSGNGGLLPHDGRELLVLLCVMNGNIIHYANEFLPTYISEFSGTKGGVVANACPNVPISRSLISGLFHLDRPLTYVKNGRHLIFKHMHSQKSPVDGSPIIHMYSGGFIDLNTWQKGGNRTIPMSGAFFIQEFPDSYASNVSPMNISITSLEFAKPELLRESRRIRDESFKQHTQNISALLERLKQKEEEGRVGIQVNSTLSVIDRKPERRIVVGNVAKNSPASETEIRKGDFLKAWKEVESDQWSEFTGYHDIADEIIAGEVGSEIFLNLERSGSDRIVKLVRKSWEAGERVLDRQDSDLDDILDKVGVKAVQEEKNEEIRSSAQAVIGREIPGSLLGIRGSIGRNSSFVVVTDQSIIGWVNIPRESAYLVNDEIEYGDLGHVQAGGLGNEASPTGTRGFAEGRILSNEVRLVQIPISAIDEIFVEQVMTSARSTESPTVGWMIHAGGVTIALPEKEDGLLKVILAIKDYFAAKGTWVSEGD